MISQLTKNERHLSLVILLALTLCGLTLAIAGRNDPIGAHGLLVMAAGVLGIFGVISGYFSPEPSNDRSCSAYSSATGLRGS